MMEPHKVAAATLKAKVHKVSELAIDNHLSKVIWRANKSTGSFHNGFIELDTFYHIIYILICAFPEEH